jgi:flagellin-specific chaperone FliS
MPNDTIYDEKETPKLEDIKDEALRAKLDEFCERFLKAESLEPELGTLYAEAIEYLVSASNESNKSEIDKAIHIMEAVHYRAAVSIVLNDASITPPDESADSEQA